LLSTGLSSSDYAGQPPQGGRNLSPSHVRQLMTSGSHHSLVRSGSSSPGASGRVLLGPETQRVARATSARRLENIRKQQSPQHRTIPSAYQVEQRTPPAVDETRQNRPSLWRRVIGRCGEDGAREMIPVGQDISGPTDVKHNYHGTFDSSNIRFVGLPSEWEQEATNFHKQFGLPITGIPRVEVKGYPSRIPAILVLLKQELVKFDGLKQEGVFRVSANKSTQDMFRQQLNQGQFTGCRNESDAMCMAALIKEWFRSLPTPLLNGLSRDLIVSTPREPNRRDAVTKLLLNLGEPNQSIFLWLLDVLGEAAQYGELNRMTPKALAIVLAPNLYTVPDDAAPMEVVAVMDAAVNTLHLCLNERMRAQNVSKTTVACT